ncbi:MAG TPA: hypothetical protein VG963_11590, partial [Polyangiaceae bacterium]|nr:hypothetical protein [Polyangiaceae bacterium]
MARFRNQVLLTGLLFLLGSGVGCGESSGSQPVATDDPALASSGSAKASELDSATSQVSGAAAAVADAGKPAGSCAALENFGAADAGSCSAARLYLSCSYAGGVTGLCLSEDPSHCPDPQPGTALQCQDQCGSNEYAVSCSSLPRPGAPAPTLSTPPGCRSAGATPGGI